MNLDFIMDHGVDEVWPIGEGKEELPSREEIKELTVCINALFYLGEDIYLVALYHMLG